MHDAIYIYAFVTVLPLGDIFLDIYHFKLGAEAVSKRKPRKEGA